VRDVSPRGGRRSLPGAVGEPGIGKTALLDEAHRLASASGFRVCAPRGSSSWPTSASSTLSALLQPVQSLLSELEPAQRNALGSMLGLGGDMLTERAAGPEAVLALLRQVAEDSPLLVVLDDAHWADRASVRPWRSWPGTSRVPGSACWRPSVPVWTMCSGGGRYRVRRSLPSPRRRRRPAG
jgi:predicted ATPase